MTGLLLPPRVKRHRGADLWPPPDTVTLAGGALLKHDGWLFEAKIYRGPHDLAVLVSLDDHGEPWGALLHVSLSVPRGYPDWDLIYAVSRAFFGLNVDAMMPIPREKAFIHGALDSQRRGKSRQVFHVIEMPQSWPNENEA